MLAKTLGHHKLHPRNNKNKLEDTLSSFVGTFKKGLQIFFFPVMKMLQTCICHGYFHFSNYTEDNVKVGAR